jgi:hypothetical protein
LVPLGGLLVLQPRNGNEARRRAAAAAAEWPSPRWREGLRRVFVAAAATWAAVFGLIVLDEAPRWSSMTPGEHFGRWLVGSALPALIAFVAYRVTLWVARGFREGPRAKA